MSHENRSSIIQEFHRVVNMSSDELRWWLREKDSHKVGYKKNVGDESVGHKSGRRIVKLLDKKQDQYTEDDIKHMRKVIGFVRRHLAQRPDRDVSETNWRYSLMNWGHDPLKINWDAARVKRR